MKQTAIDYFYDMVLKLFMQYHEEDVPTINFSEAITEAYQRAKEIEKEQQKYFFECGRNFQLTGEGTFEQYYTSTYNQ